MLLLRGPIPQPVPRASFDFADHCSPLIVRFSTSMNVYVSNTGGSDIPYGWSVEMYNPSYTGGSGAWNMQVSGRKDRCTHACEACGANTYRRC